MLAEALQDNGSRDRLQALYVQADACVQKMNHDLEAMKQDINATFDQIEVQREALRKRELLLQSSISRRQIDISVAAGQTLIESITMDAVAEVQNIVTYDEYSRPNDCTAAIDEAEIESDEDKLRAEL
jgi:hypothetical protein